MNAPILGTQPEHIDIAEDRDKFDALLEELSIKRPLGRAVYTVDEGIFEARKIGFPVLVRPSYVLGGQGMEITHNEEDLRHYLTEAFLRDGKNSVLIDRYLEGMEIEVDAICDGEDVLIPGIMEHLDRAGIHSGDSVSLYPAAGISQKIKDEIFAVTKKIALALKVVGMINIQFIEFGGELFIIEVNPRSSRTVPYISKVTNCDVIEIATRVMLGEKLREIGYASGILQESKMFAVKIPVFSTEKLPMVEVSLGPEMRSTGEALGVGRTVVEALHKGFLGANFNIPPRECIILVTVSDKEKENFLPLARRLFMLGGRFIGTKGTTEFLRHYGFEIQTARKICEKEPNILSIIKSGVVDMIIDIPQRGGNCASDGFKIRRAAAESNVPLLTSLDSVRSITAILEQNLAPGDLSAFSLCEFA
jgi:carbamoyl-phosphate synthase large subunit